MSSEDIQTPPKALWDRAVQGVLSSSGVPGFEKIADTKSSKTRKIIWELLIVIAFICCFAHFIVCLLRYLSQPVNTSTDYQAGHFEFPDVTLCHTGPYSYTKSVHGGNITAQENVNLTTRLLFHAIKNVWKSSIDHLSHLPLNSYTRFDSPISRKSFLPWGISLNFSHDAHEVIAYCKYGDKPCTFLNFSSNFVASHMQCFTFHPPDRIIKIGGEDSGLSLILFDGDRRMFLGELELLDFVRGIKVIIHAPGTIPDFRVYDTIEVGVYEKISIDHIIHKTVSRRKSPCKDSVKSVEFTPLHYDGSVARHQEFAYSNEACLAVNVQQIFVRECGCFAEFADVPMNASLGVQSKIPYCHQLPSELMAPQMERINSTPYLVFDNGSKVPLKSPLWNQVMQRHECFHRVLESIDMEELRSNCPRLCSEHIYKISIAKYQWPSSTRYIKGPLERLTNQVVNQSVAQNLNPHILVNKVLKNKEEFKSLKFWKRKFIRLKVFPRVGTYILVEESLDYPMSTFLSDIGGILGLWIGFSIMTIAEIIDGFLTGVRSVTQRQHSVGDRSNPVISHMRAF